MATSLEFTEFVCDQIQHLGAIRHRKMFGEYMVYINDKPLLLLCDNTVFIKKLPEIAEYMKNADTGIPYKSAKEHYILNIEDEELCQTVLEVLEGITPLPKPRKKVQKT